MIQVSFSANFKQAYKKRLKNNAEQQFKFMECLALFINDPYNSRLRTHKLTGQLKDHWSFSIEHDLRVVFYFVGDMQVVFEDIGNHNQVY